MTRMTPDEALAAVQPLYDAARFRGDYVGHSADHPDGWDSSATLPHAEREALWKRAADIERAAYAAPKLTPAKRDVDAYCFRCGEPVGGGLFVANTTAGRRHVSWVNVDRWDAATDTLAPHCGTGARQVVEPARERCKWCGGEPVPGTTCPWSMPCPTCHAKPGKRCKRPSGHDAPELHAERVAAAEHADLVNVPAVGAPRADAFADLPLFAAAPASAPVEYTPAPIPSPAPTGPARQLDMFGAAPITCPHCGARKTYAEGIDDARATRRAYLCDSCRRTWSVDGSQADMFADHGSAAATGAEDSTL